MKNQDYELVSVTISNQDINTLDILKISVFYSIENIGSTVRILFNDLIDLKNTLPIKGGEVISIVLNDRYGKEFSKTYIMNSIVELSGDRYKESTVSIQGISTESFSLLSENLYTSYSGLTPSDIVTKIDSNILIEKTNNIIDVITAGWTKNKFIQYLSMLSTSELLGGNYMFYEDNEGIKFLPLTKILKDSSIAPKIKTFDIDSNNPFYRYNIVDFEEDKNFNILKNTTDDMYNNTKVYFNPDKKQTFNIKSEIDDIKFVKLGKGKLYNQDTLDLQSTNLSEIPYFSRATLDNQTQERIIFNSYNKKMTILLSGDLERNVGEIINIKFNDRYNQTNFGNELAGTWLIKSLSYNFTPSRFQIKADVVKNASFDYIDKNTKDVVKSNIIVNQ